MAKLPSEEQVNELTAAFEPYYAAVGRTAHAWNHLQDELANLFADLTELDSLGLALWHALKSDRTQRDVLEAAAKAKGEDEEWLSGFPKAKDDILWLLARANELADKRNDAIHAPCTIGIASGQIEIVPSSFFGNPRARKLQGKQILNEFAWYEERADVLRNFAVALGSCLRRHDTRTWPERPRTPELRQDSNRKASRRQSDSR